MWINSGEFKLGDALMLQYQINEFYCSIAEMSDEQIISGEKKIAETIHVMSSPETQLSEANNEPAPEDDQLAGIINQTSELVSQIRPCLAIPPGAAEAGVTVSVEFKVGSDGSLVSQPRVIEEPSSSLEEDYARAAVRAIMRCGPYSYFTNQTIRATFRARGST